jgi:hypothetical protein
MGALLTLLAVGIDPTMQQAISIRTRHEVDVRQAHIPRAQSFIQFTTSMAAGDSLSLWFLPTTAMVGSVYSAMFGGSSQTERVSTDVLADCPTGNCNFPVYQTLAACFECEDISDLLSTSCFEWSDEHHTIWQTCRSELPNSLHINQTKSGDNIYRSSTDALTISASTILPLAKPTSRGTDIMRLSVINGINYANKLSSSASQCTLYWCIKTMEAKVVDGRLSEHELDSWYDRDAQFDVNLTQYDLARALNITAPFEGSTEHSAPFLIGTTAHTSLVSWFNSSLTFSNSLAPLFNSTTNFRELGPDVSNSFPTGTRAGDVNYSRNLHLFQVLRQVQNFGPMEMVSNVAKAITTYIRTLNATEQYLAQVGDLEHEAMSSPIFMRFQVAGIGPANGTAYTLQVYTHVRWA